MKYVIIGNGVAALGAIEGIRQYDKEGEILIVSEEELTTYGRPLITYVLGRKARVENLELRPEAYYQRMGVSLKLGTRVECLDQLAKQIITTTGERIPYDKVLVATGGKPTIPQLAGLDGSDVYTFTSWAQAGAVESAVAARAKQVVVIGAGLIALKAAEGLNARGVATTLLVRSRVLRVYFDETASALVARHMESKGVTFRYGESPVAVERNAAGKVVGVKTDKGLVLCDAVIVATGVEPNKGLAQCAGLKVERGIVVDDHMRTSNPDVFAAGDVAETLDLLTGRPRVIPIWPNAYNQGINAGINMAGADKAYPGSLSMNATSFAGLPTISVGQVDPAPDEGCEVHTELDKDAEVYRRLVFKGDKLVGVLLIGQVDQAGLYTSFIRFGLPLTSEAKEQLILGRPSPLFWPQDFFDKALQPEAM